MDTRDIFFHPFHRSTGHTIITIGILGNFFIFIELFLTCCIKIISGHKLCRLCGLCLKVQFQKPPFAGFAGFLIIGMPRLCRLPQKQLFFLCPCQRAPARHRRIGRVSNGWALSYNSIIQCFYPKRQKYNRHEPLQEGQS